MPSVKRTVFSEDVIGLEDVKKKLATLGKRLATNVLRRGLLAGAGLIRDDARSRVSKRTGRLKKNIIAESRGVFKDGSGTPVEHRAVALVRGKARDGKRSARAYAHFVEFGTKPHYMDKGSINVLFKGSKAKITRKGKIHPGAKAKPFMRPAFDAKKHEAVRAMEKRIRQELDKEIKKLAGKKAA